MLIFTFKSLSVQLVILSAVASIAFLQIAFYLIFNGSCHHHQHSVQCAQWHNCGQRSNKVQYEQLFENPHRCQERWSSILFKQIMRLIMLKCTQVLASISQIALSFQTFSHPFLKKLKCKIFNKKIKKVRQIENASTLSFHTFPPLKISKTHFI